MRIERGRRPGLLFDLDGTLAQTEHLHLAAFNAMLAVHGRSLDEQAFLRHVTGRANSAIMAYLFPDASIDQRLRHAEEKEAAFRQLAAKGIDAMPGARSLLEWAHRRHVATGLVTNAPRANADLMVAALGLNGAFDIVICAEEQAHSKPHPAPYIAAVDHLGLSTCDSIAIEDSVSGIASARAAGLRVIGLATARSAAAIERSGAQLTVTNLAEPAIYAYLERPVRETGIAAINDL